MFPIFYALHSDSQLDFEAGALPEVKASVIHDPDGFYNPYINAWLTTCLDEDSDFAE